MPGQPDYMSGATPVAAPRDLSYMRDAVPVRVSPDPAVIAHAAQDVTPEQAAQTIDASKATGLSLGYIASGLDESVKAIEKQKFTAQLQSAPVTASWAGQSQQHAALVKPDAEPLGKLEGWLTDFAAWGRAVNAEHRGALKAGFLDIFHAEAMREFMGQALDEANSRSPSYIDAKVREYAAGGRDPRDVEAFRRRLQSPTPGPLAQYALETEQALREYDATDHGIVSGILRAGPQMGMYAGAGLVAGPAGVAGLMYAQNKGILARRIQLAAPDLSPQEVDNFASAFSAVGAVTTAGLLGPLLRSMPGVREGLQGLGATVLTRAAATTVGQAAMRSLGAYGQHVLMGALGMSLQHVVNTAAVQKAGSGEYDADQLAREGVHAFVQSLPVALAFGAYGPTRDFMGERGRLNAAPLERAKLDAQIELAKKIQLAKTAPERALELFGLLGRGAKVFINWEAAKTMEGLDPAKVAQAEVAQDAVAVPVEEYLTKHADRHEAVKDDVKLSADGYTMNEAKARDKELRGAMSEDVAKALLGPKTPEEVLQFELPFPEKTEAPSAKAAEGKVAETVKLFRGTKGRDPSVPGRAGARFLSPDRKVAEGYAAAENTSAVGESRVAEETLHFENVLKVDDFIALKEKLGFRGGEQVGGEEVLNRARDSGYDAVSYKTKESGVVYVDLMNWLHELVKQYGGTVEKWQEKLTPEFVAALKETGSKGAVAPEEHAARVIEAMQVRDIDPLRFERLAKKSEKYIQEAAEKARSGSAAGAKAYSPRDVAVLSTYELARDVNLAKAKKAAEVVAEVDKIGDGIAKDAANNKLRGQLGLAGQPLLHLFDVLTETAGKANPKTVLDQNRKGWMSAHQEAVEAGAEPFSPEAIDYANERQRAALDEALQWFKDAARPVEFKESVLKKFLADPKPLEELRPAEVRSIGDAIRQIVKAAREETTVRAKDQKASVDEAAGEIQGELRQNASKGKPLATGIPSDAWRDLQINANAANAVQLRPKNNLRQKSAAAVKWIFNRINDAVYVRDELFRETGAMWKQAFDAIPEDVAKRRYESYDLSDKLPSPGTEPLTNVPRQYLWKVAQHRMSKGNMERVLSTSGWDKAVVDHILFEDPQTKLTVPEWDYLQSLADINENHIWPKLKAHFEEFYGIAPPKTAAVPFKVELPDGTFKDYKGGYHPLKRDARPGVAPQPEPTGGIAQYWGRDFQVPWTPGSVRERVDNSHYLVNMDWDSSRSATAQVLHWLAFDQPVRDVAKLLNHEGLAADMVEYMGQGRADMVRGWLKSSATQNAQSIPEGMEIVAKAFGWQRRLAIMSIVGGSGRLAAAQLSHPAGLMLGGEINPVHGIPALLTIFKPLTMADGEVRLFPNWSDAITHSEEVQHRAERAYNTLRDGWDPAGQQKPGPIGTMKAAMLRTAGLYLHAVDRLTTTWAWTASHNEAIAKGMEPFSREAIDYANGKTQDVMPVHDIETAAPILTNRQMGGFLIMHGFKNTLYNMRQDALAKSLREFNLAETPAEYGSAIARTAGRLGLQLAMFGGFAVMGKFALGYGQQEEESKGQWMARDFLAGQFADLPLVGGLAEPIAKWMTGGTLSRHDFTSYGNPGMAAVLKAQEVLGGILNEGREDYKKAFDVLEAALFFTGVPSRPTRRGAEHLYEALMGEPYDGPESDSVGKMFYTDKQWESIQRSLTPDED
jgi:hypothetical protein